MTGTGATTPSPLTVTPRAAVATARRLIRDNRIGHRPVLARGPRERRCGHRRRTALVAGVSG
jgi:CBS domain-containing protein